MSNVSNAPGFLGGGPELIGAPPRRVPGFDGRTRPHAAIRAEPGRAVIVVEAADAGGPDRLDSELAVRERLTAPVTAAYLVAALDRHPSWAVLCKVPLASIDARFTVVCRACGVEIFVLAHPVYGLPGPVRLRRFDGRPWLRLSRRINGATDGLGMRLLDIGLVAMAAPVAVPLMLAILAVSFGGPPLHVPTRVGVGGRLFRMLKFRTMRVDAKRVTGPVLAAPREDPRLTQLGRWLRRCCLDNLPQLWNVLPGQMSRVGPRPERPEFVAELDDERNCDTATPSASASPGSPSSPAATWPPPRTNSASICCTCTAVRPGPTRACSSRRPSNCCGGSPVAEATPGAGRLATGTVAGPLVARVAALVASTTAWRWTPIDPVRPLRPTLGLARQDRP